MFRVAAGTEMTPELLAEYMTKHKTEINNRYQRLHDAYENKYEISRLAKKPDWKPDNRIPVNFAKYITVQNMPAHTQAAALIHAHILCRVPPTALSSTGGRSGRRFITCDEKHSKYPSGTRNGYPDGILPKPCFSLSIITLSFTFLTKVRAFGLIVICKIAGYFLHCNVI